MVSSDCILVFRDHAADTINALSNLYELGDWGRKRVIATLEQITDLSESVQIAVH